MNHSSDTRSVRFDTRTGGVLGRIAGLVLGLATLVAAVFVGAVFLAAFVGFALIGALIVMLRAWWLQRQLEGAANANADLEGEFVVVRKENLKISSEDVRQP